MKRGAAAGWGVGGEGSLVEMGRKEIGVDGAESRRGCM